MSESASAGRREGCGLRGGGRIGKMVDQAGSWFWTVDNAFKRKREEDEAFHPLAVKA